MQPAASPVAVELKRDAFDLPVAPDLHVHLLPRESGILGNIIVDGNHIFTVQFQNHITLQYVRSESRRVVSYNPRIDPSIPFQLLANLGGQRLGQYSEDRAWHFSEKCGFVLI